MEELGMIDGYHPIFSFIQGYVGNETDLPDGVRDGLHVDAVEYYNKLENTDYAFFAIQHHYFNWLNGKPSNGIVMSSGDGFVINRDTQ